MSAEFYFPGKQIIRVEDTITYLTETVLVEKDRTSYCLFGILALA